MEDESLENIPRPLPEKPEVRFNVTPKVWRYLDWISRHSLLGKTGNDVAERILIQRLVEMRQEEYKPSDKL